MIASRTWSRAALVALLLLTPAVARACPVCFDANEANRGAFLATTVLLSTLPLAMVAAIGLWLRARAERDERE